MRWRRKPTVVVMLLAAGCGGSDSQPVAPRAPNAELGRAAFALSCSGCHTTRDAFDIAHFGFAASDIVRRALAHVNRETADDIAAYVASLGVAPVGRDFRPFQPGTRVLASDAEFGVAVFGTGEWPARLTPAALRAVDTRQLDVPIALPRWSVEADDSDWLPETPLNPQLLALQNGALKSAIDAYYASPTTTNLLAAIATFEQVSNGDAQTLCYGEAASHTQPRACFEARRWMSTFAAQHFLRPGADAIPMEVADLFWNTGQVAVTVYQREFTQNTHPRSMVWGWLYLGYSFAPTRFNEDNGYLGQFLQGDSRPWLATFAALRRLVDEQDVRDGIAGQRFWDAALAVGRAPVGQRANVAEFAYGFLVDWLASGGVLDAADRKQANGFLELAQTFAESDVIPAAQLNRITALHDLLLEQLR